MKTLRLCPVIVVLAFYGQGNLVGAEDLGFPQRCVELQSVPRESFFWDDTFSNKDSVLIRPELASGKGTNGHFHSFIAWDMGTGKWLARRQVSDAFPMEWRFSPDGKLL